MNPEPGQVVKDEVAVVVAVVIDQGHVHVDATSGPVVVPAGTDAGTAVAPTGEEPLWRCIMDSLCNAVLMVVAVLMGIVVGSVLLAVAVPWAVGLAGQLLCAAACCGNDSRPPHVPT